MASHEETVRILEAESTANKYYIEYKGFLSNHLAHGVIALSRLGASPERLQQFTQWYSARLEAPDGATHQEQNEHNDVNTERATGQRHSYYALFEHYKGLLERHQSTDELIRQTFPKLSQGMVGSLLHGLIHLGYGWASDSKQIILEGLAYLHHSYLPLTVSRVESLIEPLGSPGDMNVLEVLNLIKKDEDLKQVPDTIGGDLNDPKLRHLGRNARYQRRLCSLLVHRGDELVKYANRIQLPGVWDPSKPVAGQRNSLIKWLVDTSITLYIVCERRNDFVILHAVTSSWSLKNILSLVEDVSQIIQSVRVFLCIVLAVYVALKCPELKPEFLPKDGSSADLPAWDKILADTVGRLDEDEHIYKLVQVCHDMAADEPGDRHASLYKEGCQSGTGGTPDDVSAERL